jgi:hypothetical protein
MFGMRIIAVDLLICVLCLVQYWKSHELNKIGLLLFFVINGLVRVEVLFYICSLK